MEPGWADHKQRNDDVMLGVSARTTGHEGIIQMFFTPYLEVGELSLSGARLSPGWSRVGQSSHTSGRKDHFMKTLYFGGSIKLSLQQHFSEIGNVWMVLTFSVFNIAEIAGQTEDYRVRNTAEKERKAWN